MSILKNVIWIITREDLLPYAGRILTAMTSDRLKNHHNMYVRKFTFKVVQRIGMVFLKVKVATWRYQRGSRSLTINIQGIFIRFSFKQKKIGKAKILERKKMLAFSFSLIDNFKLPKTVF